MRGLRLNAARAVALLGVAFATAASAQTVTVVEYYNKTLDAYFMTGRTPEQSALDGVADFQRTGMTFQATATAAATAAQTRICRFYIANTSPFTSSHFYGRQGVDCESIRGQNIPGFSWEDYDFATQQPTSGVCPGGTTPIYRGFRTAAGGKTSNHRYSASRCKSEKTREQVIAETKAAMQQGRLFYGEASNYPLPVPDAGSGKTRAQVINELLSESAAERDARMRLYSPG